LPFIYGDMKNTIITSLVRKGVNLPDPDSVYVSDDVDPERISGENVTIFPGSRIIGRRTLIMAGTTIGHESPVTLDNTIVGKNCRLNGGFFHGAVLAGSNQFGSGAHVREGTILEEEACAAHTVGLKQTILFPFVTLGSLINFCDCFMAGGTSRKDHSEVGSSFVHFNYTPNQDKATPSMMGDVHRGVMLESRPIFLGGQGGIAGPVRIAYGCITAAGSIIRKNELRENRLMFGSGASKEISLARQPHVYRNIDHIFNNNVHYIAGLIALKFWYRHVRPLFACDYFSDELIKGMQANLDSCLKERIKRFRIFCEKLAGSRKILLSGAKDKNSALISLHDRAIEKSQTALDIFAEESNNENPGKNGEIFIRIIKKQPDLHTKEYISFIQGLKRKYKDMGIKCLYEIEKNISEKLLI